MNTHNLPENNHKGNPREEWGQSMPELDGIDTLARSVWATKHSGKATTHWRCACCMAWFLPEEMVTSPTMRLPHAFMCSGPAMVCEQCSRLLTVSAFDPEAYDRVIGYVGKAAKR